MQTQFEKFFKVKLIRDYENVWEWLWNGTNVTKRINISRKHIMKYGEYEKPLRIILNWNDENLNKSGMIGEIQSILKTELFIGEIKNAGRLNNQRNSEYEL